MAGSRRRGGQFRLQPSLLGAAGIAAHVGIAAVLVGHVVVGDADHPHRPGGESVPQPTGELGLAVGIGQLEIGLVGAKADRSVAEFVLVVAGRRHPRAVGGAAGVVFPEIPPGAHPVVGEIGVAEVAVEQVEQRPQPLDAERGVPGGGSAQVVGDIGGVRPASPRPVVRILRPSVGVALIAEAGECEWPAAARRGAQGAELWLGAVVKGRVEIGGVGFQAVQPGVVDVDALAGLAVDIASWPAAAVFSSLPSGRPSSTRGWFTGCSVCQDTTISGEASAPNCRWSPATGGVATGSDGAEFRVAGAVSWALAKEAASNAPVPTPAAARSLRRLNARLDSWSNVVMTKKLL